MKLIHFIIATIVLSCGIGLIAAGNDTGTDITLYTDEDTQTVMNAITNSGAGIIFAAINIVFTMSLWMVPALIILGIILTSMLNNSDSHKKLIRALLVVIIAVIGLRLYSELIISFTPDLSVIELA